MTALGASHPEVKQLRKLLRDRAARDEQGVVVIDGPRAVDGAFDRGAHFLAVYIGEDANFLATAVGARARDSGINVRHLAAGVADRIGELRTSTGVFAIVGQPRADVAALDAGDLWLVLPAINDPGNLGTMIRSAEAAGADGISIGPGSVDPYNPKVVRASAGAVFGITILESDAMTVLQRLGARGVRRFGAVARGGDMLGEIVIAPPIALVLGHETRALHGFGESDATPMPFDRLLGLELELDGAVRIPMAGAAESLNVAMAATVLLFEVARQRDRCTPRDGATQ